MGHWGGAERNGHGRGGEGEAEPFYPFAEIVWKGDESV